jgi:acyl-CoA reductase-like NAD-dependent aldehyde dehydrogenase
MVLAEAKHAIEDLSSWMKPEPVEKSRIQNGSDTAVLVKDPLGVVLIIGAYNYPLQLTLIPLIGAIAGGNTVVLKPSELSPATEELIMDLVPKYLSKEAYHVVTGAVKETTKLLEERWDLIFYTGGTAVGKIVAAAAAKNLTPCVLELGGKSPTIVDSTCGNLTTAAQRILWGRCLNSGQSCIAPDYILATSQDVADRLAEELKAAIARFYGNDAKTSDSYGRIVNERHFDRITGLLSDVGKPGGPRLVCGGKSDRGTLYIEPTVLAGVTPAHRVMSEEIFGPLMPILVVDGLTEAIDFINAREKPLALYLFSDDKAVVDRVLRETTAGGVTINDTLVHATVPGLPFGGVGHSGQGAYHGRRTFDAFVHHKSVLMRPLGMEAVQSIRYPPYTDRKVSILSFLTGFPHNPRSAAVRFLLSPPVLLGLLVSIVAALLFARK